ncbi:MAG TPA: T9SS type A sorting domain-containing protein, partial [Paludibacter sp.]
IKLIGNEHKIGARTGSYSNMPVNRNFKIVWVAENYGVGANSPVVCDTTVQYTGSQVVIPYLPTGLIKVTGNNDNFKVSVNNADKTVKINFVSSRRGNAEISCVDLGGKCLLKKNIEVENGENKYVINMRKYGVGTGVYIVSLKNGNELFTNKLTLQ